MEVLQAILRHNPRLKKAATSAISEAKKGGGRVYTSLNRFLGDHAFALQTANLTLDLIGTVGCFTGKAMLSNAAMLGLDCVGFLWIFDIGRGIYKTGNDLFWAGRRLELIETALLATKLSCQVTDLALLGVHGVAMGLLFGGKGVFVASLFKRMRPIGLASFFVGLAVTGCELLRGKILLKKLKKIEADQEGREQKLKIMRTFSAILLHGGSKGRTVQGDKLAVWALRHLHYATLDSFKEAMKKKGLNECYFEKPISKKDEDKLLEEFPTLVKAVKGTLWDSWGKIALYALGYFGLFIGRAYPNTKLQWSVTSSIASLWWAKAFANYLMNHKIALGAKR